MIPAILFTLGIVILATIAWSRYRALRNSPVEPSTLIKATTPEMRTLVEAMRLLPTDPDGAKRMLEPFVHQAEIWYNELKTRAETDPAAAATLYEMTKQDIEITERAFRDSWGDDSASTRIQNELTKLHEELAWAAERLPPR